MKEVKILYTISPFLSSSSFTNPSMNLQKSTLYQSQLSDPVTRNTSTELASSLLTSSGHMDDVTIRMDLLGQWQIFFYLCRSLSLVMLCTWFGYVCYFLWFFKVFLINFADLSNLLNTVHSLVFSLPIHMLLLLWNIFDWLGPTSWSLSEFWDFDIVFSSTLLSPITTMRVCASCLLLKGLDLFETASSMVVFASSIDSLSLNIALVVFLMVFYGSLSQQAV